MNTAVRLAVCAWLAWVSSACGGSAVIPGDGADGGGTGGQAGSGGGGGAGGEAGSGGSGGSSWTSCTLPGTCVLDPSQGCCGVCTPTVQDVTAVHYESSSAHMESICPGGPVSCGPCPDGSGNGSLAAFCEGGQCRAVDAREHGVSACKGSEECMLVAAGCCGSCAPQAGDILAIAVAQGSQYRQQVCNPEMPVDCPACDPQMPPGAFAFCNAQGHCEVAWADPAE